MAVYKQFLPSPLQKASSVGDPSFDGVVIVSPDVGALNKNIPETLKSNLEHFLSKVDSSGLNAGNPVAIPVSETEIPSQRVIFSCTGPLNRDFDDVRRFGEAAEAGVSKALCAGWRKPLLVTRKCDRFPNAELVSVLGALHVLYVPLEIKEDIPERKQKAEVLGILSENSEETDVLLNLAGGIEAGRCVARDIAGSDPERMTSPRTAEYVREAFGQSGSAVKVQLIKDQAVISREYPMMASVNRACRGIPRHEARLIGLEYQGEGEVKETLMFVGKGVTLDTGGLDIKTCGHMYGMSRDKSGAAAVAGIFKVLDCLRPKNLKVMGFMSMVRNSVGPEAFSCDEILKARSGKRIRIVNTDAEGRLAMLDPLCHMKEKALGETNPHIFTIATLTGHAVLTVGDGYSVALDNGPALINNSSYGLQSASVSIGDVVEVSMLRREDYAFHQKVSEYEDLVQSNTLPSSQTKRGHMTPTAFLILGSGLGEHGVDSAHPIPYSHVDMAGADGPFPGVPSGSPVSAFAARYILPNV